ncbi:MAG: hypothetical protein ACKVHL_12115 [Rhodospirillales bacterium]
MPKRRSFPVRLDLLGIWETFANPYAYHTISAMVPHYIQKGELDNITRSQADTFNQNLQEHAD